MLLAAQMRIDTLLLARPWAWYAGKGENHMKRAHSFKLSEPEMQALRLLAEKRHSTMTDVLRDLIQRAYWREIVAPAIPGSDAAIDAALQALEP